MLGRRTKASINYDLGAKPSYIRRVGLGILLPCVFPLSGVL